MGDLAERLFAAAAATAYGQKVSSAQSPFRQQQQQQQQIAASPVVQAEEQQPTSTQRPRRRHTLQGIFGSGKRGGGGKKQKPARGADEDFDDDDEEEDEDKDDEEEGQPLGFGTAMRVQSAILELPSRIRSGSGSGGGSSSSSRQQRQPPPPTTTTTTPLQSSKMVATSIAASAAIDEESALGASSMSLSAPPAAVASASAAPPEEEEAAEAHKKRKKKKKKKKKKKMPTVAATTTVRTPTATPQHERQAAKENGTLRRAGRRLAKHAEALRALELQATAAAMELPTAKRDAVAEASQTAQRTAEDAALAVRAADVASVEMKEHRAHLRLVEDVNNLNRECTALDALAADSDAKADVLLQAVLRCERKMRLNPMHTLSGWIRWLLTGQPSRGLTAMRIFFASILVAALALWHVSRSSNG